MNAWEIDPNLQLSVYTDIGTKIVLFFNKLGIWFGRMYAALLRHGKHLVELPDGNEISPHDEIACCHGTTTTETGFKKIRIANFR